MARAPALSEEPPVNLREATLKDLREYSKKVFAPAIDQLIFDYLTGKKSNGKPS